MDVALNEVVHFDVATNSPTTAAAIDADSPPTYSVFEEDTDTPILADQAFTKRTGLTGNYRASATLSTGNGFEVGKWYNVIATATVGGVTAKAPIMRFRVALAETTVGSPITTVGDKTGFSLSVAGIQAIWDALTSALSTANSIGKGLVDLLGAYTVARGAKLDRLDDDVTSRMASYTQPTGFLAVTFPSGTVASSSEVTAIQNNTRAVTTVPEVIERPDSGTDTYLIYLYLYDEAGNMEAPDSAPTLTIANSAGTSRTSRLNSTTGTLVATGKYSWTYTNSSTDTLEQLLWEFTIVEGGATRVLGRNSLLVDTTAVDFTASDRIVLNAAATAANLATLQSTATATKVVTDKLNTTLEADGGNFRYTVAALFNTPSGGAGDDPLENEVPGSYADGTAGKAIADILSNTANLTTDTVVILQSGVIEGRCTLIKGDKYSATTAVKLEFENADWNWTTETITFRTSRAATGNNEEFSFPLVIVNPTKLRLDLTVEQSLQLNVGSKSYSIRVNDETTVAYGDLIILTRFGHP